METMLLISTFTRSAILIICALSGPLCIYLGAQMYNKGITDRTTAELSGMGVKTVIKSGGPGLALVVCGITILATLVLTKFEFSEEKSISKTTEIQTTNKTDFYILKTEAKNQKTEKQPCLISKTTISFQDGSKDLTKKEIHEATELAINGLTRAEEKGIEKESNRIFALTILAYLKRETEPMNE